MASPYALDFSPLTQSIQNNTRNRLAQDEMEMRREQSSLDKARTNQMMAQSAELHPLAVQAQRQQVSAGADEAAKRKAGIYAGFIDERFTNSESPTYEKDPAMRATNWAKMVNGPLKELPYLKDKELGPLFLDPDLGPRMMLNIARGYQDPLTRRKIEADIYKDEGAGLLSRAQAAAAGNKGTGYDNLNQYANTAEGMRKEFQALPSIKGYEMARGAADRLERLVASSKDGKFGTGAGDIAMVFNFMKTLDPESIVMPGEAATARNAPGISDQMRNWYNLLISGQFLTPDTRKDFLNVVNSELDSRKGIAINEGRRYRGLARGVQVNPEHVVPRQFAGVDLDGDGRPDAGGPVRVTGDDDYQRLPSGTRFIGPDGQIRIKP